MGLPIDFHFFFKILTLLLVLFYIFFAIVVYSQIRTMDKIAMYPAEGMVKILGILHMLFALSLFLIGFAIL